MDKPVAIEIKNIKRSFGEKQILNGINLRIYPGEFIVVRGKNGSGKTTLLRTLATLLRPQEGDAWLNGHSVLSATQAARRQIGWVHSSQNGFLQRLTGFQNLLLFGSLYGLNEKIVKKRLDPWLHLLPLKMALETPFYLCSSGMKQALLFFRGVFHDPPIIILDEPTTHFDDDSLRMISAYFKKEAGRNTFLMSSHQSGPLDDIATRQVEIREGIIF